MAGGDHDAADGALRLDSERNRRRRRRFRREYDLKVISSKNFRGSLPKPVGEKTAVKPDNDFSFRAGFRVGAPEIRRRLRDARDIGKRKIFRDDRAPAVRAEFDLRHGRI